MTDLPADATTDALAGEVVVVTGPPGAGKSTVSAQLVERFGLAVLLDGDAFTWSIKRGYIEPWRPESHTQNTVVVDALGAAVGRFAAGGYVVVVDWVLGPWFLDRFRLAVADAAVHYAILRPSADVTMARATARGEPWLVEPEPIAQMYAAFTELGEFERYVLDTTTLDAATTVDRLHDRLVDGVHRLP
jgi:tRNA uridine 5-carbamoylmethylation protein Kti12